MKKMTKKKEEERRRIRRISRKTIRIASPAKCHASIWRGDVLASTSVLEGHHFGSKEKEGLLTDGKDGFQQVS